MKPCVALLIVFVGGPGSGLHAQATLANDEVPKLVKAVLHEGPLTSNGAVQAAKTPFSKESPEQIDLDIPLRLSSQGQSTHSTPPGPEQAETISGQDLPGPAEKRLIQSAAALQTFRETASDATRKLFDDALCVAVAPRRDPGQSAVDAKGFVSCRPDRGGTWSNPAAIAIEGGGTFWPVVGVEIDVIMLTTNRSTASHFRDPERVLGADPLTVPGPVRADQMPLRTGDPVIFVYQQSAAEMRGINIAGATMSEDKLTNALLYKKELSNSAILRKDGGGPSPAAVDPFLAALRASGAGQSGNAIAEVQ